MSANRTYVQQEGKVVEDSRFAHLMALALDKSFSFKSGVIRCVVSREGDVAEKGFKDKSELHKVSLMSGGAFAVGGRLEIAGQEDIVASISMPGFEFLGLEDPDIWVDTEQGVTHLYFTLPFVGNDGGVERYVIGLGHAAGPSIDSLVMQQPVLLDKLGRFTAKEVSIPPKNTQGIRLPLFESSSIENNVWYSTVRVAIANDMNGPWTPGKEVFHPKNGGVAWAGGHASPGPFFSREFVDVGEGRVLGVMNGREADRIVGDKVQYGAFTVGLYIYDYENGNIDWVSKEPFIQDREARTITFASQIVESSQQEAVLYAHVDDSFVRAYTIFADGLKELLP